MSRTSLDARTLARSLRNASGDGSMEWACWTVQTSVLLDVADLLDENAKLREQNRYLMKGDLLHVLTDQEYIDQCERERLMQVSIDALDKENAKLREQGARLFDKAFELGTENAKLRELVREMRTCLVDECKRCHEWGSSCDLEQEMRELGLGVEVEHE